MYKLRMFHSTIGWVSFGLFKTVDKANLTASNVVRFGNGYYTDVKIEPITRRKYIWDIIKMNLDNRF